MLIKATGEHITGEPVITQVFRKYFPKKDDMYSVNSKISRGYFGEKCDIAVDNT